MKEYSKFFLLIVTSVAVGMLVYQVVTDQLSQGPSAPEDAIILGSGGSTAVATNLIGTSAAPVYLTATSATSTSNTIMVGFEADQIDLNVQVTASTTASQVQWQYEFSHDGTNWFGEDTKSSSGSTVTHQAATTTHQWTPGTTIPANKNIGIGSVATRFFRLKVYRAPETANVAVWVQGIAKSQ